MTDENDQIYAEEGTITPFSSAVTVVIQAGGRKWEGSPEEFKALRDNLIGPFSSTKTVDIKAGGREWKGAPEEFKALRDKLNRVEFRSECDA